VYTVWIFNQLSRPTQPGHPSTVDANGTGKGHSCC